MELVYELQRSINDAVTFLIGGFAEAKDWRTLWIVLPLGILFGAIHALTPGHSKAILASYLIGSRFDLSRSVAVAGTLALTHVLSAVVLALLAAPLVLRTIGAAGQAPSIELISRGLLAIIGAWFIIRAVRRGPHLHREGLVVGVVAGLIPCPLTLFTMFLALSKGVAVVGLTFAIGMCLGVGFTLASIAAMTVWSRNWAVTLLAEHGTSFERINRALDFATGALLFGMGTMAMLR